MSAVAWSAMAYLLARAAWHASGLVVRAAKPRSARSFFQRPLLGRWSSSAVRRLRSLASHGPDAVLPRPDPSSQRSLPRKRYPALGAGGVPFAAAMQPDFDAFFGGLQAAVVAGFVLLIAVVVTAAVKRFTQL